MTNDETQMTNRSMTDSAATPGAERGEGPDDLRTAPGHWALVIDWSLGFGHWSFRLTRMVTNL
jgi:hypothetical protein